MSRPLRFRFNEDGTKFWLYPQPGLSPEPVYIDAVPGTIGPGPKDHRIYVIDAKEKKPYKKTGKPYERIGEWIERIGWKKFFEVTGFPFTKYHIDDFRYARTTFNTSTHVRL